MGEILDVLAPCPIISVFTVGNTSKPDRTEIVKMFVPNESTKEGKNKSAITKGTEWAKMRR